MTDFPTEIINLILEASQEKELLPCMHGLSFAQTWIDEEKLNWNILSVNPAAIHLLEEALKGSHCPEDKSNPEKIYWFQLFRNPAAIHLLQANPEKICWFQLSENPAAIHLLEGALKGSHCPEDKANLNKIDWYNLSINPAAIHLLQANPEKIYQGYLSANPAIFQDKDQSHTFDLFYNLTF